MSATFATLQELDDRLARKGFFALTPFWSETLQRFYGHPTARLLGARVGRGGVKSVTGAKVLLNEVISGDWPVPPGERHFAAIVSENVDEASERLRWLKAALDALGITYTSDKDSIELRHRPLGFIVRACRIGAVSGFRCIAALLDEAAKWEDRDTHANPAKEIHASIKAMQVTHGEARTLVFSSPWGKEGFHYETIERGDTDGQIAVIAPTWIANPSITEDQTRRDQPDYRIWLREYKAEPQDAKLAAFNVDDFDACCNTWVSEPQRSGRVFAIDASAGKCDAFTGCSLAFHGAILVCRDWRVWDRRIKKDERKAPEISRWMAAEAAYLGCSLATGDQFAAPYVSEAFTQRGFQFLEMPWDNARKSAAVSRFRMLMTDREIAFMPSPEIAALRTEVAQFEERILPSGLVQFGARRGGHDDRIAAVLTGIMSEWGHVTTVRGQQVQIHLISNAPLQGASVSSGYLARPDNGLLGEPSISIFDSGSRGPRRPVEVNPGARAEFERLTRR